MRTLIAEFVVPGEPVSKSRARFTKRGSKTRVYTPERTKEGERRIEQAFRAAAPAHVPGSDMSFRVEAEFLCGTRQRRDVDNMLKLICDGLNKVAWDDDVQVSEAAVSKVFVETRDAAATVVRIYTVGPVVRRTAVCEHCGCDYPSYESWEKRRFCSSDCHYAWRRNKNRRVCAHCKREFQCADASRVYCSRSCQSDAHSVIQQCAECGADVRRPLSWSQNGRPFCSSEHRADYWRKHRAAAARGVCSSCGGSTSKKSYKRCRACVVAGVVVPVDGESGG